MAGHSSKKRAHQEIIEISSSEDDDAFEPAPKAKRSSRSFGRHISLSSQTSYGSFDDEIAGNEVIASTQAAPAEIETFELYSTIKTKVVGIRYHAGYASIHERVILRREPQNSYDSNAIQAKHLDRHELVAEGRLAGHRGVYQIPLDILLYGPSEPNAKAGLAARLRKEHIRLDELDRTEAEERRRRAAELKRIARAKKVNKGNKSQFVNPAVNIGAGSGPEKNLDDFVNEAAVFNPREAAMVAEQYGAQENQLEAMPRADQPSSISTRLLPFQLQGLAWLLAKETPVLPKRGGEEVVQMWKRPSENMFTNIATNYSLQNKKPHLARGGILADDMGLGKTVQIISLIAADKQHNRDAGPTLIVAPVSVMSNWSHQAELHVSKDSPLKIHTYHGQGRKSMSPEDLKQYDIVITTYGTLAAECMPRGSKGPPKLPAKSGLYSFQWRRIVLDEGHTIRNPNTKNALAATAIDAHARWALTGTPIINSLKDLFSLIKFIGLSGGLDKLEIFNSVLIRPLKSGDKAGAVLLQALMATICLRRRKDMSFVDLRLPPLTEHLYHVELSEHELKKYDALSDEARGILTAYTSASGSGNSKKAGETYRHLLEVLLRLREVCNHWKMCEDRVLDLMSLLEKGGPASLPKFEQFKALQDLLQLSIESREPCPICLDEQLTGPVITPCGHFFCRGCIEQTVEPQHKCPMCREELAHSNALVPPRIDCGEDDAATKEVGQEDTSAKTEELLKLVHALHKEDGTKIVIFSQWRRYLDILAPRLSSQGYRHVRLHGSMPAHARDAALRQFNSDKDTTILLASLGVCAVGLNLVAANTVIMCDSWWASAIEDQAIDRVHRLGQKRACAVWRLVVKGSVEERTLEVQAEKRKLASLALREGEQGARKQRGAGTLADITKLLG